MAGDGLQVEVLPGECEPDGITGGELRDPRGGEESPAEGQRSPLVDVSGKPVGRAAHVGRESS